VGQDLRAAWRFLRRRPTAPAVAVLTLAIAIAVCTLAVGFFDQAFWRPVDSGRNLLTVYNQRPAAPGFQVLSYPDYVGLRDELREDIDVAAFLRVWATIRQRARPGRVQGELVSGNYFRVLGATTIAGRPLDKGDVRVGPSDPRVILGYDLWRRDFGSDRSIIGSRIRLGRAEYTVVGVAAPGFHGATYPSEFWVALTSSVQVISRVVRDGAVLTIAGHWGRVGGKSRGNSVRCQPADRYRAVRPARARTRADAALRHIRLRLAGAGAPSGKDRPRCRAQERMRPWHHDLS
jgi:hypothetical protein